MAHKIALNFEDGVTRFIEVRSSETVADAAYRLGLNIPMDCRDGACGSCKCYCESGNYTLGAYIDDAMTQDEASEGFVLTCQMRATSDCVIRVPASSTVCKIKPQSIVSQMLSVRPLSPSSIGFSVKAADNGQLSYLAGQYVNVCVPNTSQTRSYSFSSMPKDGVLEFLVRNIPGGLMSTYLSTQAKPGDKLTLTGPIGSFYLRNVQRPLLMLAGGTGLAPFLAMLDELAKKGSPHPIHLIYGVTHDADLVEVDKIESYAKALPSFTFATVVADVHSKHPLKGFVTHHISEAVLNGGDVDIYLCGPPPMVDAVRGFLAEKGVKPANFHFEKFNPSEK